MASFRVDIRRTARAKLRRLPGYARPIILNALKALVEAPNPPRSRLLDVDRLGLVLPPSVTLRRLRLDPWRVVYAVDASERRIVVLAVRRRPPYCYEDVADLAQDI